MHSVCVIGGTGPTGPHVVAGLLGRGDEVTVVHTGRHEVDLGSSVRHIHGDVQSADALEAIFANAHYDIIVAAYGRLRDVARSVAGKTAHLIAIGGVPYKGWVDENAFGVRRSEYSSSFSYSLSDVPVSEDYPLDRSSQSRFVRLMIESEDVVRQLALDGAYAATMLRFPLVYGPRQPQPIEWSIIRRLLDGRQEIVIADGGIALTSRVHAANAAAAVLASRDSPPNVPHRVLNVADRQVISYRTWATTIASAMGRVVEFVSVPFELASVAHPYCRGAFTAGHHILDTSRLYGEMSADEVLTTTRGLRETTEWYLDHPIPEEQARALGDAFNYSLEDEQIASVRALRASIPTAAFVYQHPYLHAGKRREPPSRTGEGG